MDRKLISGIKGIAIILVFMTHVMKIGVGGIGVVWFFILNSFLITLSALKNKANYFDPNTSMRFYIQKFFRIMPMYWLLLIVIYLVDINFSQNVDIYTGMPLFYYLQYLFLIKIPYYGTWFIRAIIVFYLIFPLFFMLFHSVYKKSPKKALILFILVPFLIRIVGNSNNVFYLGEIGAPIEVFSLGIFLGFSYFYNVNPPWERKLTPTVLILCLSLTIYFSRLLKIVLPATTFKLLEDVLPGFSNTTILGIGHQIHAISFSIMFFTLIKYGDTVIHTFFKNRFFEFLGNITLGIYISHFVLAAKIFPLVPFLYVLPNYLYVSFVAVTSIGFGVFSAKVFEPIFVRINEKF